MTPPKRQWDSNDRSRTGGPYINGQMMTSKAPDEILTPGPGAFSPSTDRFGKRDASMFSFGSATQRPPHVCISDRVVSPGPVYMPDKGFVSTLGSSPKLT